MTQNRRYDMVCPNLERGERERAMQGDPVGLTVEQVRRTGRRVDLSVPVPVSAWVTHLVSFADTRFVEGFVVAHTDYAVLVSVKREDGSERTVWVYDGAVRGRHP